MPRCEPDDDQRRDATTLVAASARIDVANETAPPQSAPTSFDEMIALARARERLVFVQELGRGGMGRVDLWRDQALARTVARKMALAADRHGVQLLVEAQVCAQLEHPSIVPVYDLGFEEGSPFYTMRVVRGRTLRAVLEDASNQPAFAQLIGIVRQVCLALDYAHTRGVVHRDLKPENIVVGEFGEVYVLDWGVAHVSATSGIEGISATERGPDMAGVGSPGYVAPEQALGEHVDARTDVFALGVILYELVAGRRPFRDDNLGAVLKRIAERCTTPPSTVAARPVTAAFDALALACLERSPERRPPSARHLAQAIDDYLDGEKARAEREREAEAFAHDGLAALALFEALDADASRLREEAEVALAKTRSWEPVERKQPAWRQAQESKRLAAEAARALARAEAAFARALGRVSDHAGARRGLATIHHRQFAAADERGDDEVRAQHLDLARAYDDGTLALELADRGRLHVTSIPSGVDVTIARYEPNGSMLAPSNPVASGVAPFHAGMLDAGSYLVTVRHGGHELRYPLLVRRAHDHALTIDFRRSEHIPNDFVRIPGGPFLALLPGSRRPTAASLPDFAIMRFPVTFGDYAAFLEALPPPDRSLRTSSHALIRGPDGWRVGDLVIEGEARKRVPLERMFDLPAAETSWYDATAFAEWKARSTGLPLRLPTDLEWEKAMRGADGRSFPMGNQLDPAFAKMRESRPEASQPEPIGVFDLDASPYGVRDLAGGVGDWTSSSVDGAPLPSLAEEGTPSADQRQAYWRGGTWGTTAVTSGVLRYSQMLFHRTGNVGFRLALSLDPALTSSLRVTPMRGMAG